MVVSLGVWWSGGEVVSDRGIHFNRIILVRGWWDMRSYIIVCPPATEWKCSLVVEEEKRKKLVKFVRK